MTSKTYGFIGLGLIGGSIAKAIRQYHPAARILACDPQKDALHLAREEGIADEVFEKIDQAFTTCDFLFLCASVATNIENLKKIAPFLNPDCILTDVGSVKSQMHKHIAALGLTKNFIGGHPMAGSERTGYQNSKAILLENAYYIMTFTEELPKERTGQYWKLIESIHAIPLIMMCEEHDYVTAAISHLPHLVASSLVNLIRDSDLESGIMKMIAAGGFKDITRIASASPAMWQQICSSNAAFLAGLLEQYIHSLSSIHAALIQQNTEELFQLFNTACIYRDSFAETSCGPIKKVYTATLNIPDKTGALANVVKVLADADISIKNIGIVHNREQDDGILRIEFYSDEVCSFALNLLEKYGYQKGNTTCNYPKSKV